jgi:hypothetical protein
MGNSMDDHTADLAALADGSIPAERRDALLARPDMAAQREALAAIRATEVVRAPDRLRAAVAAIETAGSGAASFTGPARAPRRRRWRLPALAGAVAAAAVAAVLVLGGSEPTVAQAARLALAPATRPAPAAHGGVLDASVGGVAYPYFGGTEWDAAGARADRLDGRRLMTVVYTNRHGQRVSYAIADGPALAVNGGTVVDGKRVLHDGPTTIVTWLRKGHTCILAARGVDARQLVELASW